MENETKKSSRVFGGNHSLYLQQSIDLSKVVKLDPPSLRGFFRFYFLEKLCDSATIPILMGD